MESATPFDRVRISSGCRDLATGNDGAVLRLLRRLQESSVVNICRAKTSAIPTTKIDWTPPNLRVPQPRSASAVHPSPKIQHRHLHSSICNGGTCWTVQLRVPCNRHRRNAVGLLIASAGAHPSVSRQVTRLCSSRHRLTCVFQVRGAK